MSIVYARPEYISTLATSTPIAAHVPVDFELRGCPIDKRQLLEVISAHLHRRAPRVRGAQRVHRLQAARDRLRDGRPRHAVPRARSRTPGCGALCPAYDRGCYGCFGPMETPEHARRSARGWRELGADERDLVRVYRTFNAGAAPFREESEAHERG